MPPRTRADGDDASTDEVAASEAPIDVPAVEAAIAKDEIVAPEAAAEPAADSANDSREVQHTVYSAKGEVAEPRTMSYEDRLRTPKVFVARVRPKN